MKYGTLSAWESNGKKLTHDLVEYEIIKTRDTINAIVKRPIKTSREIIYERDLLSLLGRSAEIQKLDKQLFEILNGTAF